MSETNGKNTQLNFSCQILSLESNSIEFEKQKKNMDNFILPPY